MPKKHVAWAGRIRSVAHAWSSPSGHQSHETSCHAVPVRHRDDQQALETTEAQDPEVMARQILEALPQVVALLPPDEIRKALNIAEACP